MKLAKDSVRSFAGLSWTVSACFFLWLFSHIKTEPFSFESFVLFSFMFLGGSVSYHFLVELLSTPYDDNNSHIWKKLALAMVSLMLVLILTCGSILVNKYIWPHNSLLALITLLFGYCGLWYISSKINFLFKSLHAKPVFQSNAIADSTI